MEGSNATMNAFVEQLLSINRIHSEDIIREVHAKTNHFADVEDLIVNALILIGDGWDKGTYSLAQVYMSGVICEEIVEKLLPEANIKRIAYPKIGIGVFLDHHALGKRIVKSVVKSSGYEIIDFGHGLNVDEIVEKTVENGIDVLLISTLMLPSALKIVQVRDRFEKLNLKTKIIVGGSPFRFDEGLWKRVKADADGKNATDIIAIIESVVQQ